MSPLLGAGAAVLVIVVAGFPGGYLIARRPPLALLLAPLSSALTATTAVILMLLCGGTLTTWLVGLAACQYPLMIWICRRRPRPPLPHGGWIDCLCYAAPLLPPLTTLRLAPTQWDAQSIWWMHAAYFSIDGAVARAEVGNPWLFFSHTDYPPLLSAVVAAAWRVGGPDFWVAQAASTVVTVAGIAVLAYAVRTVTAAAPTWVSRLAAALVALSTWGFAPIAVTGGLADPLWASTFVAGCVLLLVGGVSTSLTLPLLLVTISALTKNEGFVAVAELAVLATLRHRRRVWRFWLPVVAGILWSRLAGFYGATNDLVAGGHFTQFLRGDPSVWHRLGPIGHSMWSMLGILTVFSMVSATLGNVFLRRARTALGVGSDLWLWAAYGLFFGTLTITYLTSPNDITWHLATSADRVTVPLTLLAVASAVIWGTIVHAASAPRTDSQPPALAVRPTSGAIMPTASLKLTVASRADDFAPGGKP